MKKEEIREIVNVLWIIWIIALIPTAILLENLFSVIDTDMINGLTVLDSTAPRITIVSPVNGDRFIFEDNELWVWINTDKAAVCKYSVGKANFDYNRDGIKFMNTNSMHHSTLFKDIYLDENYTLYYRCSSVLGALSDVKKHSFRISSYPPGSKGGGGVIVGEPELCYNECHYEGEKECMGEGYSLCGHYDEDICLEWSTIVDCGDNQICKEGKCLNFSSEEIAASLKNCTEDSSCDEGEYCFKGLCRSVETNKDEIAAFKQIKSPGCISRWECGNWSNCVSYYDFEKDNEQIVTDKRTRICIDTKGCSPSKIEKVECEKETEKIEVKRKVIEDKDYYELYSKENLIARLVKSISEGGKLDIELGYIGS